MGKDTKDSYIRVGTTLDGGGSYIPQFRLIKAI